MTSALEGYWKLDGDAADASGNARELTLVGSPGFGAGLLGQALLLPGSEALNATRPGDDAAFNLGADEFTIQAWVRFNSLSSEQIPLEKFTGGSGPGWTLSKLAANTLVLLPPVAPGSSCPRQGSGPAGTITSWRDA